MSEEMITKCGELIQTGNQLLPQGGFEISGYNARLQNKYLEWRKACLEILEQSGPIGFPYKQKILSDKNGGFFFQQSTQLIVHCIRELSEKLKMIPQGEGVEQQHNIDLPSPPVQASTDAAGVRILRPPQKTNAKSALEGVRIQQPSVPVQKKEETKKVFVVGEADDPLHAQLLQFLREIGIEEVDLERQHGQMLPLDTIQIGADIQYAFFIINSDDLMYAMFEIGHFVGKLGNNHVCILHMSDVKIPKDVPGVLVKPIVVKIEEASLGILRELKAAGYHIQL